MKKNLKREIITTGDGSSTIHLPDINEQYHSRHGAINEAKHVFIKEGFDHVLNASSFETLDILEIGFGTGLNAFITFLEAEKVKQKVNYVGVEAYPVSLEEAQLMNYPETLQVAEQKKIFDVLHQNEWETSQIISNNFFCAKRQQFFSEIEDVSSFNLIYFDAFGARVQPELWTVEIFQKMYKALKINGVLVTYSAKGSVRRAMKEVGFDVERLPGPPGKREMLRAIKLVD